jgi:hypothetical protein
MSFSSWHMIFILSEGGRPQVLTAKMTCTQHRTIPKLLQVVDLPFNCVMFFKKIELWSHKMQDAYTILHKPFTESIWHVIKFLKLPACVQDIIFTCKHLWFYNVHCFSQCAFFCWKFRYYQQKNERKQFLQCVFLIECSRDRSTHVMKCICHANTPEMPLFW